MSLRQRVILGLRKLIIRHVRWLGQVRKQLEGVFFLRLGFVQQRLCIHAIGIDVVGNYPAFQDQHANVIRIQRERFIGGLVHFGKLLLIEIILHQPRIDNFGVLAFGILRDEVFAHFNSSVGLLWRTRIVEGLVGLLFLRIHFRRFRGSLLARLRGRRLTGLSRRRLLLRRLLLRLSANGLRRG